MARNDDRAARRRAKRKGEDPDSTESESSAPAGTPGGEPTPGDAVDPSVSDAERAENEARQGIAGAPLEVGRDIPIETDFDPAPGGEVVGGEVTTKGGPRVVRFLRASWTELQRVRWPDRPQVAQGTAVVLGFVVIAGLYLGLADVGARAIVNLILGT